MDTTDLISEIITQQNKIHMGLKDMRAKYVYTDTPPGLLVQKFQQDAFDYSQWAKIGVK